MSHLPFSAYDPRAVRLLSAALSEALAEFRHACRFPLNATDLADVEQIIALNLMRAYDEGERDPGALKRAGYPAPRKR